MLFAVISSAVIFPVSVFCDNLTDTDSSGIVQLFADIYTKWFWVPLIVIAIIWGFSQNDQAKEKYKKSMIVLIVVYVIASKWSNLAGKYAGKIDWHRYFFSDRMNTYILDLDKRRNYSTTFYNLYKGTE